MWEAKQSLQHRLKGQKHNRKLRKRIALLNKEIEQYAKQLSKQQWDEICNSMNGQLSTGRTWHLLRFLLDPDNNKKNNIQAITKLIHAYDGTEEEFLKELEQKYITQAPPCNHPSYNGNANSTLDEEITEAEIRAALQNLNTKSAPGPDGITNKTLRNLDDKSITILTEYMNECWIKGKVPAQWKKATITLIPKPGKSLRSTTSDRSP